jgi:hypothetical protein
MVDKSGARRTNVGVGRTNCPSAQASLIDYATDNLGRVELLAVIAPPGEDRPQALPTVAYSQRCENKAITVVVGPRLGVSLSKPHTYMFEQYTGRRLILSQPQMQGNSNMHAAPSSIERHRMVFLDHGRRSFGHRNSRVCLSHADVSHLTTRPLCPEQR